ncbi:MAG: 30S ribosomal protein S6 [Candidatus Magasanikbacteria bacterium]
MQNYELLLILPGTLSEDEVDPLVEKISKIIEEAGASNLSIEKLEKRRLAYPIKHIRYGYFNLVYFEAESEKVVEIQEKLRLIPELLRALVQKTDPEKQTNRTIKFGHPTQGQHKDDRIAEQSNHPFVRREENKTRDEKVREKKVEEPKEAAEVDKEKELVTVEGKVEVVEKEENKGESKEEVVEAKEENKEVAEVEEKVEEVKAEVEVKEPSDKKTLDMDDIDKKLDEILDIDLSNV